MYVELEIKGNQGTQRSLNLLISDTVQYNKQYQKSRNSFM